MRMDLIAFTIEKLFPIWFVHRLIDIVFLEMQKSQARVHGALKEDLSNDLEKLIYNANIRTV